jgi:hypothetical protein
MELHKTTQLILLQLVRLLENFPEKHYRKSLEVIADASVANNVCTILKNYRNLLHGMERGEIDYHRKPTDVNWELNKVYAIESIRTIIHTLDKWPSTAEIKVVSDIGCMESHKLKTNSTYGRELLYCMENTIHHMVVMKTGVFIQWPEVEVPRNFGMISESYFN